jgi:hypothetical protein
VEKSPTVSQNETAKCFLLPPSLLSNGILWEASVLQDESWFGHILRNEKIVLLNEEGSVPYYSFN